MSTENKNKRARKEAPKERDCYAILQLFLSGDDDYGALKADEYGIDRIFRDEIKNASYDDEEADERIYDGFNVGTSFFEFESEKARSNALSMMQEAVSHVLDYDHSKHSNVYARVLNTTEYETYKKNH